MRTDKKESSNMSQKPGPGRRAIFAYAAGQVKRWHTATHVFRQQNVMEHSGGVAMWITLFHPNPSAQLLKAALVHDLGELKTGDMPRWAKQMNPEIEVLLNRLEETVLDIHGLNDWIDGLPDDEKQWLHGADLFDAFMFLLHNAAAGNQSMQSGLNRSYQTMKGWHEEGKFPEEMWIAVIQIRAMYPWIRIF